MKELWPLRVVEALLTLLNAVDERHLRVDAVSRMQQQAADRSTVKVHALIRASWDVVLVQLFHDEEKRKPNLQLRFRRPLPIGMVGELLLNQQSFVLAPRREPVLTSGDLAQQVWKPPARHSWM